VSALRPILRLVKGGDDTMDGGLGRRRWGFTPFLRKQRCDGKGGTSRARSLRDLGEPSPSRDDRLRVSPLARAWIQAGLLRGMLTMCALPE
jgi:hypothetical protein